MNIAVPRKNRHTRLVLRQDARHERRNTWVRGLHPVAPSHGCLQHHCRGTGSGHLVMEGSCHRGANYSCKGANEFCAEPQFLHNGPIRPHSGQLAELPLMPRLHPGILRDPKRYVSTAAHSRPSQPALATTQLQLPILPRNIRLPQILGDKLAIPCWPERWKLLSPHEAQRERRRGLCSRNVAMPGWWPVPSLGMRFKMCVPVTRAGSRDSSPGSQPMTSS